MICANLIDKIAFPLPIPIHPVISPDPRLLWYLLGAILVSALCCGLLLALRVVRRDPNQGLKQEEPQPGHAWNLRSILVSGQLAASIVLLAAAFLFVHNLLRATSLNPGFDVDHTTWAYMRLVPRGTPTPARTSSWLLCILRSRNCDFCLVSIQLQLPDVFL
jgi:hypothetical protein